MKLQKIGTACVAIAAVLTIGACGDSGGEEGATGDGGATTASSSATTGGDPVTNESNPPSATVLNGLLTRALDPQIPAAQKTDLVQGSSADPQLFDKLVKAKADLPGARYQLVPPVRSTGSGQGTVKVKVNLPNQPEANLDAQIVYDQGRWKLSRTTVCLLLGAVNVQSPICPKTN